MALTWKSYSIDEKVSIISIVLGWHSWRNMVMKTGGKESQNRRKVLKSLQGRKFFIWCQKREGITTLRTYQNWIFYHTVIETCFEMLKSSEHAKLWRLSIYKYPNFFTVLNFFSLSPNFNLLSIPYIIHPLIWFSVYYLFIAS